MKRRVFIQSSGALLAANLLPGCGADFEEGNDMPQEFTIQPSPKRSYIGNNTPTFYSGKWTPSTGASDTTYATENYGRFARLGPLVYIEGLLSISSVGAASSATSFGGLPFVVAAPLGGGLSGATVAIGVTFSLATNVVSVSALLSDNEIHLRSRTVASASVATNAMLANGTKISFSGWYFTDER